MPIIEANGLTKTYRVFQKKDGLLGALKGLYRREYKTVRAVEDVSFSIEPGEMVAFLGPNGAGKTTTLKMLSGLIYPSSGTARVLDYVPWERQDAFRRQFALVMGQKNQLWWDLPGRRQLPAPPRDLLPAGRRVQPHPGRADGASRGGEAHPQAVASCPWASG
jgi:ABC-2 type transport system ATP-binding protein